MKLPIRKIINWLSLAIFLIAMYYIFQNELIIALGYVILAVTVFLPRVVYRRLGLHSHFSNEALDWGEITFSLTIVLSVAGYLWLFDNLFDYDSYVHFVSPLFIAILIAAAISIFVNKYKLTRIGKADIVLATLVIVLCMILLWELFEFSVTKITSKNMFFEINEPNDTVYDVLFGLFSLPVASVIIYKYYDWFIEKLKPATNETIDNKKERNEK